MLVLVLIVISCALFVLWSWVRLGQPSLIMFLGALPLIGNGHLAIGLKAKLFVLWSWVKSGLTSPFMFLGGLPLIGNGHLIIGLKAKLLGVWSWVRPRQPLPPVYPGALPLLGHMHQYIGDAKHCWKYENKLSRFSSENGGIILMYIFRHPVYVITDLEDSLTVANTCLDKPYPYDFAKPLYNVGLVTTESSLWKVHRKLLNPVFNQQVLNTLVREYDVQAKILVSQLAREVGKASFDVQPYICKNIIRNVFRATFGINSNDQSIDIYAHATEEYLSLVMERIQKAWLHLQFIFNMSTLKKKHDKLLETVKRITNTVIKERKLELKLNKSLGNDNDSTDEFKPLIDRVLELNEKHNDILTDDEISEHLDTNIAATYESTTKALTLILLLIGSHQDVQNKLCKELQEVLGDEGRELDRHDLTKLVYLEAVIKESLRLLPPAPRICRAIYSPVQLKHYTLPANSMCYISIYYINRDPSLWGADADQFRPERWLDTTTLPDNPNAFATFSIGRRNCIGKQYAIMSLKIYLANILRRYRVTGDINKLETTCDVVVNLINGHHMSFDLRK